MTLLSYNKEQQETDVSKSSNNPSEDFISTREAANQLGVALSTVQGWVEAGLIRAWKTPGGHRRIPVAEIESMRQQQNAILQPEKSRQALRVLVVEDDALQRELYEKQFEKIGLELDVRFAENGYQGLIEFGKQAPDCLITDLEMPEMDGFRMIRELQSHPSATPETLQILVVTGLKAAEIDIRGGLPERAQLLFKPLELAQLRSFLLALVSA